MRSDRSYPKVIEGFFQIESGWEYGPTLQFSEIDTDNWESWKDFHDLLGVEDNEKIDPRKFKITLEIIGDRRVIRDSSPTSTKDVEE